MIEQSDANTVVGRGRRERHLTIRAAELLQSGDRLSARLDAIAGGSSSCERMRRTKKLKQFQRRDVASVVSAVRYRMACAPLQCGLCQR